jgi:Josephin
MLHQRQNKSTCAVQALNNAAGVSLITIRDASDASLLLNQSGGITRHGDADGNYSIATLQSALQARHGRQYVLRHVKCLTERKAGKWLRKHSQGRFVVMEYNARKDKYHWIAVHAKEQRVIDGALKRPYKVNKMGANKLISKVYRLAG